MLDALSNSGLACAFGQRFLFHLSRLLIAQELVASKCLVLLLSSLVLVFLHDLLLMRFLGHLPYSLVILPGSSATLLVEIKLWLKF